MSEIQKLQAALAHLANSNPSIPPHERSHLLYLSSLTTLSESEIANLDMRTLKRFAKEAQVLIDEQEGQKLDEVFERRRLAFKLKRQLPFALGCEQGDKDYYENDANGITIVGGLLAGAAFARFVVDPNADTAVIFLLFLATICFVVGVVMARLVLMFSRQRPLQLIPILAQSKIGRMLVVNEYRLMDISIIVSASIVAIGLGILPWTFVVQLYHAGGTVLFYVSLAILCSLWVIMLAVIIGGAFLWLTVHCVGKTGKGR